MKAHQFISALDDARYGNRRVQEDTTPIAKAPSHAPTSSAGYKTPSSGKSKDEGERMGGKDAIKKAEHSIPAPIAKAPSHAPTSSAGYKTSGEGKSKDEGEKINKENVKEELIDRLADADSVEDIQAIMAEGELAEGGHKAGCTCGFCKNKGSFGKKKKDEGGDDDKGDDKEGMEEGLQPPMGRPMPGMGKRPGQRPGMKPPGQRMGFRHPSAAQPRPKAAMAPYQPSMERLERSSKPGQAISEMADELLEAPEE
jgi:hypothetical protein